MTSFRSHRTKSVPRIPYLFQNKTYKSEMHYSDTLKMIFKLRPRSKYIVRKKKINDSSYQLDVIRPSDNVTVRIVEQISSKTAQ